MWSQNEASGNGASPIENWQYDSGLADRRSWARAIEGAAPAVMKVRPFAQRMSD